MSSVTIASLQDIGYAVDLSEADQFSLLRRSALRRGAPRQKLHLGDDIRRGPIQMIDHDGNVVRVINIE